MSERLSATDPISILKDIVSIPSYVRRRDEEGYESDERDMRFYIADFIKRNTTMRVDLQEVVDGRFNVVAQGRGPTRLVLVGHMDTVEPRIGYKHSPFSAVIEDGKLYGLGSCDMKSGLASILSAAATFQDTEGLMLLFYIDEEYDFAGMRSFVRTVEPDLRPDLIVSADGEGMEIVCGCRGLIEVSGHIRGVTGHASRPDSGRNAINGAVKAVNQLKTLLAKKYTSKELGTTSLNLAFLHGGLDLGIDERGESILGQEGNNIPDLSQFVLDIRPATPDLTAKQVLEDLGALCAQEGFRLEKTKVRHDLGAWASSIDEAQVGLEVVKSVVGEVKFCDPSSFGYVDIAMLWQRLRRPAFVIGPGGKETAHTVNEYVEVDKVYKAQELFRRLIERYGINV